MVRRRLITGLGFKSDLRKSLGSGDGGGCVVDGSRGSSSGSVNSESDFCAVSLRGTMPPASGTDDRLWFLFQWYFPPRLFLGQQDHRTPSAQEH